MPSERFSCKALSYSSIRTSNSSNSSWIGLFCSEAFSINQGTKIQKEAVSKVKRRLFRFLMAIRGFLKEIGLIKFTNDLNLML